MGASRASTRASRRVRPDRGPPVQPDVRDDDGRGRGDRLEGVPPAGDRAGDLHQLQERRCSSRAGSRRSGSRRVGGKSFRNEITPGNFLFRMREFEQMEMEFFVPPAEAEEWYRYWIDARLRLVPALRRPRESRLRDPRARRGGALALLAAGRATSSTSTRSAGRSSRVSPTEATTTCRRTRALGDEARVGRRRGHRRALRPARDRAGGEHRPDLRSRS